MNKQVPIAEGTSMLGTSQLEGCMGDFCSFDVGYLEGIETSLALQGQVGLFTRRLMD